jgi:hypothetical protein
LEEAPQWNRFVFEPLLRNFTGRAKLKAESEKKSKAQGVKRKNRARRGSGGRNLKAHYRQQELKPALSRG